MEFGKGIKLCRFDKFAPIQKGIKLCRFDKFAPIQNNYFIYMKILTSSTCYKLEQLHYFSSKQDKRRRRTKLF